MFLLFTPGYQGCQATAVTGTQSTRIQMDFINLAYSVNRHHFFNTFVPLPCSRTLSLFSLFFPHFCSLLLPPSLSCPLASLPLLLFLLLTLSLSKSLQAGFLVMLSHLSHCSLSFLSHRSLRTLSHWSLAPSHPYPAALTSPSAPFLTKRKGTDSGGVGTTDAVTCSPQDLLSHLQ